MLTYGFYNSYEHDRVYDAEQFAMMFDGLIADGVYAHIGQKFAVIEDSTHAPNRVIVQSGRAYFHHTWTYNDSNLVLNMDPPEVYLNRYDAVVIDIQDSNDVRENKITFVKGTPSAYTDSQLVPKPTMINEGGHHQIPLAFIYRQANVNPESQVITTSDIWIVVGGTTYCPYVTGILETFPVTEHYARWAQDWENFKDQYESDYEAWVTRAEARYNADTTALEQQWNNWVSSQESSFTTWREGQESDFNTWKTQQRTAFLTWMAAQKDDFDDWFANLRYVLDGDVAGHLQNEIDEINRVTLNPLSTSKGGTGNTNGYIRTGLRSGETAGANATAEGINVYVRGDSSHAEGQNTSANGGYSHAEGLGSKVLDSTDTGSSNTSYGCHAEGYFTECYGTACHSEGYETYAGSSPANNGGTPIYPRYAHAEGHETHAYNDGAHAEGTNTYVYGEYAHAENGGENYYATSQIQNEFDSVRDADDPPEEIYNVYSYQGSGENWYVLELIINNGKGKTYTYYYDPYWYVDQEKFASPEIRVNSTFFYFYCTYEASPSSGSSFKVHYTNGAAYSDPAVHVEINLIYSFGRVEARGTASHAEGYGTKTLGTISHAEGEETSTTSSARASHAEGNRTIASGEYSHVEGLASVSSGKAAHAEGQHTKASGNYSHAEGFATVASGQYSHAGGVNAVAKRDGQFVHGVVGFGGKTEDIYGGTLQEIDNGARNGINLKLYSTSDTAGYGAAKIVLDESSNTDPKLWLLAITNTNGAAKMYMVNSRGGSYAPILTQISSVGSNLPNVTSEYASSKATITIINNNAYRTNVQLIRLI